MTGATDSEDVVINVVSANGFLEGHVNTYGTVTMSIKKDTAGIFFANTYTSVINTINVYQNGYYGDYAAG